MKWVCSFSNAFSFSRLEFLFPSSLMRWVEGDALELPFSDGSFDAITMVYGLRNVVDRRKAMQEILRVLKAGSRVSILDFNKSNQYLTASAMEWMIENVVVPVALGYGLSEEYRYLKSSIKEFATGKELEELALEVGFSTARHYEINGEALWAARFEPSRAEPSIAEPSSITSEASLQD
ncbi:2-phytyl-1,4-beta-naphthoquinone methyltransferase, chloroplastic-like isoform X2 [Prosopis cineraria]|nr:2-phytyl-1,4-beta-naphthoquinone methyltransferase, chloroplastic-like isoform X2 [Prosopis cineraria]XP_054808156.1 2-phytyl-1,4-beta-naphthoquinone methyltransferase, chloroplastic-like isoform X2 [Prosopis cineraria]